MALSRKDVKAPVLRKETVPLPALGGEVIVRELMLEERLRITSAMHAAPVPQAGESEQEAAARRNTSIVSLVLSICVIDPDGEPLMSRQDWRVFGGSHLDETLVVFQQAMQLSGFDSGVVEKN